MQLEYEKMPFSLVIHPILTEEGQNLLSEIDIYYVVGIKAEGAVMLYLHDLLNNGYFVHTLTENGAMVLHKFGGDLWETLVQDDNVILRDVTDSQSDVTELES